MWYYKTVNKNTSNILDDVIKPHGSIAVCAMHDSADCFQWWLAANKIACW